MKSFIAQCNELGMNSFWLKRSLWNLKTRLGNWKTFDHDCKHPMMPRKLLFHSFSNTEITSRHISQCIGSNTEQNKFPILDC